MRFSLDTGPGGELLVTEVNIMKGTGNYSYGKTWGCDERVGTGSMSYVRTNANQLGIFSSVLKKPTFTFMFLRELFPKTVLPLE
ncbi:MAG: hypothetical protein Ct9H300mP21_07510 [Pseudomonadota bacterium]|nr:MAG: hypothetical protein Ct9H300mP21_07510 [Pseudomonadota bacterium]